VSVSADFEDHSAGGLGEVVSIGHGKVEHFLLGIFALRDFGAAGGKEEDQAGRSKLKNPPHRRAVLHHINKLLNKKTFGGDYSGQ